MTAETSIRVLCLGTGRMGSQIGLEYALGGHRVVFVATQVKRAQERVQAALEMLIKHRVEEIGPTRRLEMCFRNSLPADERVDLVVESLPEDRGVKSAVLRGAAAIWPDATIATNSSSITVSEVGDLSGAADRIVATHYWNPPLLMPLVEVLGGRETPEWRVEQMVALLRGLGKRPVLLGSEAPGMLWNRLQLALLRECLWLLEHRVATSRQIDEVVRDGLARRWRLLGPFETVSLGGAAVFDAIARNLFPTLSAATEGGFAPYVEQDAAVLEQLAQRRDLGLAADLVADRSRGPCPSRHQGGLPDRPVQGD